MKKAILLLFIVSTVALKSQGWVWAKIADSTETFTVGSTCMTPDNNGNFFLATNLRNSSASIGFSLIKLNSAGNHIWKKYFFGDMNVSEMAYSNSKLFLGGTFNSGVIGMDTLSNNGQTDIFITCINATNGVAQWSKTYGGSKGEELTGLCSDVNSNIYATGGVSSDTINFGGTTYYKQGGGNTFLIKLTDQGSLVFSHCATGNDNWGKKVRVDKNGFVYTMGTYMKVKFNNDSLITYGYLNHFLAKFDSTGNYQFLKNILYHGMFNDMEINSTNNIVATGFDNGNHEGFATTQSYDTYAQTTWGQTYPQNGSSYGEYSGFCGISTRGNDTYVLGGSDFSYWPGGLTQLIFSRYSNTGQLSLLDTISFSGHIYPSDIITDSSGDQIISGVIGGSISFDNNLVQGNNKIFIAKYSSNTMANSVKTQNANENISVYPNPAVGIITISRCKKGSKILLRSATGITITSATAMEENFQMNFIKQPKGVYFLEIETGGEKVVKKVLLE